MRIGSPVLMGRVRFSDSSIIHGVQRAIRLLPLVESCTVHCILRFHRASIEHPKTAAVSFHVTGLA